MSAVLLPTIPVLAAGTPEQQPTVQMDKEEIMRMMESPEMRPMIISMMKNMMTSPEMRPMVMDIMKNVTQSPETKDIMQSPEMKALLQSPEMKDMIQSPEMKAAMLNMMGDLKNSTPIDGLD